MDELTFRKKNGRIWTVEWMDREHSRNEVRRMRALPHEAVVGDFSELERLILRMDNKIALLDGQICTSRLNLEAGSGPSSDIKMKQFCMDYLTPSEERQFGTWLKKITGYF